MCVLNMRIIYILKSHTHNWQVWKYLSLVLEWKAKNIIQLSAHVFGYVIVFFNLFFDILFYLYLELQKQLFC